MNPVEDKTPIICPTCKKNMEYNQQDNFYLCPQCKAQFWPVENTIPCPGCGRPMRYKEPGYHQCPGCASEFWPPEEETGGEEEEPPHVSYAGLGLVYLKEIKRGNGRSKNSSGRKRKKQKTGPRVISQRYLL